MRKEDIIIGKKYWICSTNWNHYPQKIKIEETPQDYLEKGYFKYSGITILGNSCAKFEDIFKTKQEALNELNRRTIARQESIANKILTQEDVVRYMYKKMCTCEEYTDEDLNIVIRKKVKELFNIDLEE